MRWSAERHLAEYGRRLAVVARVAVVAVCGVLAPFAMDQHRIITAVAVTVMIGWSLVYCGFLPAGPGRGLIAADIAVICAICLSQPWTVPPEVLTETASWVFAVVQVTIVGYQWHAGPAGSTFATFLVAFAYSVGSALPESTTWVQTLPLGLWLLVDAVLSRGLFLLVRRGGRRADAIRAHGERARRQAAVSSARRADIHEHLAALHDTAAATLMMVGMGVVGEREPWLAEQVRRDLETLIGNADVPPGNVDLIELLRPLERDSRVRIEWTAESPLLAPYVPADAIRHSVRESLANVRRHAGVDTAAIRVEQHGARVVVLVTDAGKGFNLATVPSHRRGLSHSIIERMARVGGEATVSSRSGVGTEVRLEWPHG